MAIPLCGRHTDQSANFFSVRFSGLVLALSLTVSPSPTFHTAKPYPKQVSVQPRPLAVNTTLPAFAAERRAAAQLLLGAGRTDGRPTVTYYAGSVENTAS